MTVTESARGRANRRKGHDTERSVARYLRSVGFAGAERAVRTGYRVGDREVPDPLDITGVPGVVWSVKNDASNQIAAWLNEAEIARNHHGAELAILVTRRRGKADVSRWWTWVSLPALVRAVLGTGWHDVNGYVCLEFGDLVPMLHRAGYGDADELIIEPPTAVYDPSDEEAE